MPDGIRDVSKEITSLLQGQSDIFADISLDIDPLRERITTDLLESLGPEVQEQQAIQLARVQEEEAQLAAAIPAASQETAKILADLSRGAPSPAPFAAVAESIAANRAQQIAGILEARSKQRTEERHERALRTNTTAALASILGDVARTEQVRTKTAIEEIQAPAQTFALLADAKYKGIRADNALADIQSQINQRISATQENLMDFKLAREKVIEKRYQNDLNQTIGIYAEQLKLDKAEADALKAMAENEIKQIDLAGARLYGAAGAFDDAEKKRIAVEKALVDLIVAEETALEYRQAQIAALRGGASTNILDPAEIRKRTERVKKNIEAIKRGEQAEPLPELTRPQTRDIDREALETFRKRREDIILPLTPDRGAQDERQKFQTLLLKTAQSLEERTKKEVLAQEEWSRLLGDINKGPLASDDEALITSILATAAVEGNIVEGGANLKDIMIALGVINAK